MDSEQGLDRTSLVVPKSTSKNNATLLSVTPDAAHEALPSQDS